MKLKNKLTLLKTALSSEYDLSEANEICYRLIEQYVGFTKVQSMLQGEFKITSQQLKHIDFAVKKLKEGIPLQHVFGYANFYGLEFKVTPNTLIPRPETEELIELILHQNPNSKNMSVLDIGTGCGCIPISLKTNRPQWSISSMDISEKALEIAKKNAKDHNTDITYIHDSILKPTNFYPKYDLIISNPPYILPSEKQNMTGQVLNHEPEIALFIPENDPVLFYRHILDFSITHLLDKGTIYFEINPLFKNLIVAYAQKLGFTKSKLIKDLNNKIRFIKIAKN